MYTFIHSCTYTYIKNICIYVERMYMYLRKYMSIYNYMYIATYLHLLAEIYINFKLNTHIDLKIYLYN